jgi:membrane protease YdiL (CAAX protease family)
VITDESSSFLEPVADKPPDVPDAASLEQTARTPDPDNPPWGVLKALLTWFVSVACLAFVPLLVVIPYILYVYLSSGAPRADALATDKNFLFLSILGVIPAHLLTFGVAWIVVTDWGRHRFWLTLGFTWPKSFGPWKCVGLAVLLLGIGALVTSYFGGSKTQLDLLIESSYQTRVATAFLAAATGPFVEELVYRGILYSALQRAVGVTMAVVLVSILFAGVHVYQYYNNLAVIAVITLLSVTLTVVRAVTGRLLPSFMIHLIFNGIQSLILVLQPFFQKANTVVPNKLPATNLIETVLRHLS